MENIGVREGILFRGDMVLSKRKARNPMCTLYMEGLDRPVYALRADSFPQKSVDQTFQEYVRNRGLGGRRRGRDPFPQIQDEQRRLMLFTYADEQAQGVDLRIKSFRFVHATEQERELANQRFIKGNPNLTFILTSDKSDVRDWQASGWN